MTLRRAPFRSLAFSEYFEYARDEVRAPANPSGPPSLLVPADQLYGEAMSMAYVPCDRHGEPFRGKSCGFYPTLQTWDTKYAKKLKVCPDCSRDLVVAHAVDWSDSILRRGDLDRSTCTACGVVLEGGKETNAFWATLYVDGLQRRDFAARYCEVCTRERIQEFHLDAG